MTDTTLFDQLAVTAENEDIEQLVVGAVITDGDKMLLLQRPDDEFMGGIFELPSGKVETNETLDVALVREVKEETGLDVAAIGRYLGSFDYTPDSGKASRQFNFVVDVEQVEPITLTEHDSHAWLGADLERPVTDAVRGVLVEYQNG
jgi:8-oxo-dGTP diphosphatase